MKKLSIVLLALALVFAFAACGGESENSAEETSVIGTLTMNGTTVEEFNNSFAQEKGEGFSCVYYDDLSTMLLALEKGDIDWISSFLPTARYIVGSDPRRYTAEERHGNFRLCMALDMKNTEMMNILNDALNALKEDGTLAALQEEYIDHCDPAAMPEPAELPVIEGAETVRVVVTGDIPPIDYMTADGKAAGYNVALLAAISQQAQINVELLFANAASRAMMINSGKADVVFWVSTRASENATYYGDLSETMAVTVPYLETTNARIYAAE